MPTKTRDALVLDCQKAAWQFEVAHDIVLED